MTTGDQFLHDGQEHPDPASTEGTIIQNAMVGALPGQPTAPSPSQATTTPHPVLIVPESQKSKEQWVQEGIAHRAARRYNEALNAFESALQLDPTMASASFGKGTVLLELGHTEEAKVLYKQAFLPDTIDAHGYYLKGAALSHLNRYEEALSVYEHALALDPKFAFAWNGKGITLYYLKFYEEALVAYEKALDLDPKNNFAWNGKGEVLVYLQRYTEALEAFQQALDTSPPDTPVRLGHLNNLGIKLFKRYGWTGMLDDLDTAIWAFQLAVNTTSSVSLDRHVKLRNLALGLNQRYVHTKVLTDLEASISACQQAIENTPSDRPKEAVLLTMLGSRLLDRYEYTGALTDLNAGITALQQATEIIPSDESERPELLNNLGAGLLRRYTRLGELADLDVAIQIFQHALDASPPDASYRWWYLNNLGSGLSDRYSRTGAMDDLEAAIQVYQQALDTCPPDAPDRPGCLSNLSLVLRERYGRTGALGGLEAAISACQLAVDIAPSKSPDRPRYLTNLGNGLRDRYLRTRTLGDLDAAISACQLAVDTTPPEAPDRPARLTNLGSGLLDRYMRTKGLADLDAGISALQQAVESTLPDAPARPVMLSNLGISLYQRYMRIKNPTDLDAGISALQEAVESIPPNAYERPRHLSNLGVALSARYERTGSLADLDASISACQQAVDTALPDAPERSGYLTNLGARFNERYEHTRGLADLESALRAWEASWAATYTHFNSLPVRYQLGQQRQVGRLGAELVKAYLEQAIRSRPSRYIALRHALEISESSKSRLLTQLIGRGSLPVPPGSSMNTAARELQLLRDLTTLDTQDLANYDLYSVDLGTLPGYDRLQQRQLIERELEELWARIAQLSNEGAEYVALRRGEALTWQDLTQLAKDLGDTTALLSLFTTAQEVFLFVLRAGGLVPRVVQAPLPAGWGDLVARFFREVHRYTPGLHRGETWDHAPRSLLGQAQQYVGGIERLILAPAGTSHLLPWSISLERAGWQTPDGDPLPLVTLPALSVLPRLRQRPRTSTGPALVVGNPLDDLPSAEAEASMVAKLFGTTPLLRTEAAKAVVLSRLAEASLIHLATHAFFDPEDPLNSGIVLADGILTAREVLEHRLQADMLVLSACESGQAGSLGGEELAGLSQAFLQAGVRSLLVSLWRVNDPATAALMQAFYDAREAGADKALALRQAMTKIQQDPRWSHPHYWGAFVLVGDWD